MRICLKAGDVLQIRFYTPPVNGSGWGRNVDDSEDGEFEVHFDSEEHPNAVVLKETAGLAGNKIGEANAILYLEEFKRPEDPSEGGINEDSNILHSKSEE